MQPRRSATGQLGADFGRKGRSKIADENVKKSKSVVETPHQSKEPIKATWQLDPSKTPKEMNWEHSSGPDAGKPMHAIIDDTPGSKDRPKEFTTKPNSGHTLHFWKCVKE
jgi:uncharacterized protein (TIGR03067 family)